jgi:type IV pilus assembly protein PilB
LNNVKTTPEDAAKSPKKTLRLGEYLVMIGLIDKETLNKALNAQKSSKKKLGEILMDMGVADDVVIAKALAVRLKIPYGRIDKVSIPDDIISLVPPELAEKYSVIPLRKNGNRLLVAMANPLDLYAIEDLRFYTQLPIDRAVVPMGDVLTAIEKHYPKPEPRNESGIWNSERVMTTSKSLKGRKKKRHLSESFRTLETFPPLSNLSIP